MRELTFRAWVDGRMVAVRRLEWAGPGELIVNGEHWLPTEQVMQGTGIADGTGREVFEGDIVIDRLDAWQPPRPWLVAWGLHDPAGPCVGFPIGPGDQFSRYEILGNRWEHPHLLAQVVPVRQEQADFHRHGWHSVSREARVIDDQFARDLVAWRAAGVLTDDDLAEIGRFRAAEGPGRLRS